MRRRTTTWTDLIEQLYEGAWKGDLQRFRSPYAFRGHPCAGQGLVNSLARLAARRTENPATYDRDGIVWSVNFVDTHRQLPKRVRATLEEEHSDTLTAEMLNAVGSIDAFNSLSSDLFVAFIEPPSLDAASRTSLRSSR